MKLDGSDRIGWKVYAKRLQMTSSDFLKDWAVKTQSVPMKGKWQPLVMVSAHLEEPPSANSGDHFHKLNYEERWKAFEFLAENVWFVVKFGI